MSDFWTRPGTNYRVGTAGRSSIVLIAFVLLITRSANGQLPVVQTCSAYTPLSGSATFQYPVTYTSTGSRSCSLSGNSSLNNLYTANERALPPSDLISFAGGDSSTIYKVCDGKSSFQGTLQPSLPNEETFSFAVSGATMTSTDNLAGTERPSAPPGVTLLSSSGNFSQTIGDNYDILHGALTENFNYTENYTISYTQPYDIVIPNPIPGGPGTVITETENCTDTVSRIATGSGSLTYPLDVTVVSAPAFSPDEKAAFEAAAQKWGLIATFFQTLAEVCPPCAEFAVPAAIASDANELICQLAAADPIDTNFTVIPQPIFTPFPPLPPDSTISAAELTAYNALFSNISRQTGYGVAMITAINRLQGAAAASNATWEQNQLLAAKGYAYQITVLRAQETMLLSNLQSALQFAGQETITIDPADVNSYVQSVAQYGLPASAVSTLANLGFNSAQISALETALSADNALNPASYPQLLTDQSLIGAITQSETALAQFAADRNDDLAVNCSDLALVKASFGLTSTQAGFDPFADVNGDGVVNVLDLAFVAKQLPTGTTCP